MPIQSLILEDGITLLTTQDDITVLVIGQDDLVLLPLMGAIWKAVQETPAIIDLLPGGFWSGPPHESANETPPYGTLTWIAETDLGRRSGIRVDATRLAGTEKIGYRNVFQVSLIGEDYGELEAIREAWLDTFHPAMEPFPIRSRRLRSLTNGDSAVDFGTSPGLPSGYNSVHLHWDLTVITAAISSE